MSWEDYFEKVLDHFRCDSSLASAALIQQDGSVLAQTKSFPEVRTRDITAIMVEFDFPGTLGLFSFYLGDTKFIVIQGVPNSVIRGRAVEGDVGVVIKKTKSNMVVGIYHDSEVSSWKASATVENVGDYCMEHDDL